MKIYFKGVLAFDANTGFWIQHSMPNYPPPPTGKIFLVHYRCVSYQRSILIPRRRLNTDRRWSVYPWSQAISMISVRLFDPFDIPMVYSSVEQLRYTMINAYSFNIPEDFKTKSAFDFWRHITPDQIGNSFNLLFHLMMFHFSSDTKIWPLWSQTEPLSTQERRRFEKRQIF